MSLLLSNLARQQVISNLLNYRLVGIVLGSLLGFAGAYVFTTALRFYNRYTQLMKPLKINKKKEAFYENNLSLATKSARTTSSINELSIRR